jgi:hypothetical protein
MYLDLSNICVTMKIEISRATFLDMAHFTYVFFFHLSTLHNVLKMHLQDWTCGSSGWVVA